MLMFVIISCFCLNVLETTTPPSMADDHQSSWQQSVQRPVFMNTKSWHHSTANGSVVETSEGEEKANKVWKKTQIHKQQTTITTSGLCLLL